jgi:hypothetical protein
MREMTRQKIDLRTMCELSGRGSNQKPNWLLLPEQKTGFEQISENGPAGVYIARRTVGLWGHWATQIDSTVCDRLCETHRSMAVKWCFCPADPSAVVVLLSEFRGLLQVTHWRNRKGF